MNLNSKDHNLLLLGLRIVAYYENRSKTHRYVVWRSINTSQVTKVKVKWSRYRPGVAQSMGRGLALLFHDRDTRRGWVVSSRPGRTLLPGQTRYPFYTRLIGPQGRSLWADNLVPTGIRFRTVQPVVSRYTDWATCPTLLKLHYAIKDQCF